jgi:hypothetical protein
MNCTLPSGETPVRCSDDAIGVVDTAKFWPGEASMYPSPVGGCGTPDPGEASEQRNSILSYAPENEVSSAQPTGL